MIEFLLSICDENNSNCKNTTKIKELANGPNIWLSTVIPKVVYNINNNTHHFNIELHNYYNLICPHKYFYEEFHFLPI